MGYRERWLFCRGGDSGTAGGSPQVQEGWDKTPLCLEGREKKKFEKAGPQVYVEKNFLGEKSPQSKKGQFVG